ncbi:helix-turn-helix domain-containing protein [Bartonella sp. DGB1]|uniref:helix-turn-helix domain-containing protein n=1 Tax=Bartonella sp. DGB1 TaxID=3239807 RepID=UPI0035265BAF
MKHLITSPEDIGFTLDKVRKQQGLSLEDLEGLSGCSYSSLYQWRVGNKEPKLKTILKMTTALKVKVIFEVGNTEQK